MLFPNLTSIWPQSHGLIFNVGENVYRQIALVQQPARVVNLTLIQGVRRARQYQGAPLNYFHTCLIVLDPMAQ